jgi:undecaprenyl-diphosphatase
LALPNLAAALALTIAAAGDGVLPGDVTVARAVQDAGIPGAPTLAEIGYWLGSTRAIIGVGIVLVLGLILMRDFWQALLVVALLLLRTLNPVLKNVVESARPTPDLIYITEHAKQFGFPSGHVMGVTLLYGGVFYLAANLLQKRWQRLVVQALTVIVILVTGYSRIYRGAHWPTDVLGGYLWGMSLLLLLIGGFAVGRSWIRR